MYRTVHRLRVFAKRVPSKIFVVKRDGMTGGWRKLLFFNRQDCHAKEDELGKACSMNESEDDCIYGIGGKARRKESLGRPRHRQMDIRMDLRDIGWAGMH
jgi:hypothetical protein